VRELTGVVYRDLDDLQAISDRNAHARQAEVASVREIVDEEAARFMQWWQTLEVVPTIAALTERAERLREQQLAKTLRTLDASPEVRGQLEALTRAIVKQLLHDPIATLRQRGDRDEYVHAVRKLFRLDEPVEQSIAEGVGDVEPALAAGDRQ
jgi:glutamyl-tRNA reductase